MSIIDHDNDAICHPGMIRRFMHCTRSYHWSLRFPTPRRARRARAIASLEPGEVEAWVGERVARPKPLLALADNRWSGMLDLCVRFDDGTHAPLLVKSVPTIHIADALAITAYHDLLGQTVRDLRGVGYVWYIRQGELRVIEPDAALRLELAYVREAMLRTRLTAEIPTSSATATMCAVCPYRDLCADDVWVDDGDGVDTVPTFEHVYIGT